MLSFLQSSKRKDLSAFCFVRLYKETNMLHFVFKLVLSSQLIANY